MPLSPDLLQAVAAPEGGKLVIVMGAGCSFEPPTDLPLARELSEEIHRQLVADGILADGECSDPSDLSCLADSVYTKTGSQRDLVSRIESRWDFRTPKANDGYLFAAALMREGIVADVVTLNFDMALPGALSEVDSSARVSIINGPQDFRLKSHSNVWFLHRNVMAQTPDCWVLRTAALEAEWRNGWQSVISSCTLAVPVVVFAGLGSPASVLTESITRIRNLLDTDSVKIFLVDPVNPQDSPFRVALGLPEDDCIQLGWCDFMESLQERVVLEQTNRLSAAADQLSRDLDHDSVDNTPVLDQLRCADLLTLGRWRAVWLLSDKPYEPDHHQTRMLIADLLIGLAWVSFVWQKELRLHESGFVEVYDDERTLGVYMLLTGKGTMSAAAAEARVMQRLKSREARLRRPQGAFVSGLRADYASRENLSPPPHLVVGRLGDSIVDGGGTFRFIHMHSLQPIRHQEAQRQDS